MLNTSAVCDALIQDIGNQLKIDLIDFVLIPIIGYEQVPNYRLKMLCLSTEKAIVVNYLKEAYNLTEAQGITSDGMQYEYILESSNLEEMTTLLRLKDYL